MDRNKVNQKIEYIRGKWRARFDDDEWITMNGTHVMVDKGTNEVKKGPDRIKQHVNGKSGGKGSNGGTPKGGKMEVSDNMKPKNTGYNISLKDNFMEFQHKNAGNRRNPSPLYNLFNEVKDNGGNARQAVEDEFYKTRLNMCTEGLKEISRDEADDILWDNISPGVRQGWMREYNHEVKPHLVTQLTSSPEVHNAALNMMYTNYKEQCKTEGKDALPYEEFLTTPVKMYRGGNGKEYKEAAVFSSYTFDKKVAESFTGSEVGMGHAYDPNGVIYEAEIRPIDTYGSLNNNGEMEIFVPRNIAPNGNRDEADVREDEEPESWITVNSTPVPLDKSGNMVGNVADKIRESKISPELRKHFDRENKKVSDMMKGKVGTGKSIEMDNGQILERYSMDEMKNMILQEAKDNGEMWGDTSIAILYRNGDIEVYSEGDDTSKMKMSNIKGVIYSNEATDAYAGTGIKIENYNETCAGDKYTRYGTSEEEDDWRIDFE